MAKWMNQFLFGGPGAATRLGDTGLAILRVGVGLGIAIGHGWVKLYGQHGFGPPRDFVSNVEGMGFPSPLLFAWMATAAEFLGGLLLAIGLLTRPAALVLVGNMLVAAFLAHWKDPLFAAWGNPNKELARLCRKPG